MKGLTKPLLGCSAIEGLHLIQRIAAVDKELNPKEEFPLLFEGLGKMDGKYTIQLKDEARPFALSTPCRVATPLLKPEKQ